MACISLDYCRTINLSLPLEKKFYALSIYNLIKSDHAYFRLGENSFKWVSLDLGYNCVIGIKILFSYKTMHDNNELASFRSFYLHISNAIARVACTKKCFRETQRNASDMRNSVPYRNFIIWLGSAQEIGSNCSTIFCSTFWRRRGDCNISHYIESVIIVRTYTIKKNVSQYARAIYSLGRYEMKQNVIYLYQIFIASLRKRLQMPLQFELVIAFVYDSEEQNDHVKIRCNNGSGKTQFVLPFTGWRNIDWIWRAFLIYITFIEPIKLKILIPLAHIERTHDQFWQNLIHFSFKYKVWFLFYDDHSDSARSKWQTKILLEYFV